MTLDRRLFLKGLAAAAVAVNIPLKPLLALAKVAEDDAVKLSTPLEKEIFKILYVDPKIFMDYEKITSPQTRFQSVKLHDKGIDHLLFKNCPVSPFKGNVNLAIKYGNYKPREYGFMHDKLVNVIKKKGIKFTDYLPIEDIDLNDWESYPEENYDN